MKRVGADVGGTFTDLVLWDDSGDDSSGSVTVHKVPSTPANPARAVMDGLAQLCELAGCDPAEVGLVLHGTTVATNIIIERTGARTGLITTSGFRDILHIARKKRPLTFSSYQDVPWQAAPLVPRADRLVVTERVSSRTGEVVIPLDEDGLRQALGELRERGVAAVAICFLGSFASPVHEQRAGQLAREELPDSYICTSSDVAGVYREYERFNTTVVNAYVGPRTAGYLDSLERSLGELEMTCGLRVMTSSGGVVDASVGRSLPVQLLMSGPAAGLLAGRDAGMAAGHPDVITLDVGGTSTDIGVAPAGRLRMKHLLDTQVRDQAVMVPMVDVETIGAGGGSIASVSATSGRSASGRAGVLSVGPRSAGAEPGPACYGRGGTEATATDAAAVLGWLRPGAFFGGRLALDTGAARTVIDTAVARPLGLRTEEAALGVHTVLAHNMASSIRLLSERKGLDPRGFALVALGGAGPLFACAVAKLTGIGAVVVPPHPGIGSAIGLLSTDLRYEHAATVWQPLGGLDAALIEAELGRLEAQAQRQLTAAGVTGADASYELACDCRYAGQGYELRVPAPRPPVDPGWIAAVAQAFHEAHDQTYGRRFDGQPVQIVNVRVTGVGRMPRLSDLAPVSSPAPYRIQDDRTPVTTQAFFQVDGKVRSCLTHIYQRSQLRPGDQVSGPAIIEQLDSTVVVLPGFTGAADAAGNLVLTAGGQS
jgi:N-methylhydantoinase A